MSNGYMVFENQEQAVEFSAEYGKKAGLAFWRGDQNGSKYLWDVVKNQETGQAAVEVIDGPDEFQPDLVTREYLLKHGWFKQVGDVDDAGII